MISNFVMSPDEMSLRGLKKKNQLYSQVIIQEQVFGLV